MVNAPPSDVAKALVPSGARGSGPNLGGDGTDLGGGNGLRAPAARVRVAPPSGGGREAGRREGDERKSKLQSSTPLPTCCSALARPPCASHLRRRPLTHFASHLRPHCCHKHSYPRAYLVLRLRCPTPACRRAFLAAPPVVPGACGRICKLAGRPELQSAPAERMDRRVKPGSKSCARLVFTMSSKIEEEGDDETAVGDKVHNILPLNISVPRQPIMGIPEIKAAVELLRQMARNLHGIISDRSEVFNPPFQREGSDDAFLQTVIQPIYNVMQKEAARSEHGTMSHSKWRNYDDLNEYFWSEECLKELKWPMDQTADFFTEPTRTKNKTEEHDHVVRRRRVSKTNFVEVRSFLQLFKSFYRMWVFFILSFQAIVTIAFSPSGSLCSIFEADVFRTVSKIFITAAILNFILAMLEIILNWKAWKSLKFSQRTRCIMKLVVAIAWLIILPTIWKHTFIYNFAIASYMLPTIFSALFFIFPPIGGMLEHSNSRIIRFFLWWTQTKLYVANGMYEDTYSRLKYTTFWFIVLICKLVSSFYAQISLLVEPTRTIMSLERLPNEWHVFPNLQHNLGVVITIWAPVVLVYFMDMQMWYAMFSTFWGGLNGAFQHLGEIQTLGMLRSRFVAIPGEFGKKLIPKREEVLDLMNLFNQEDKAQSVNEFADIWNAFINSLREEDLLNNREKNMLIATSSGGETSVIQWPPFLLASKIAIALDMAKSVKEKDEELMKRIHQDCYIEYAVTECYDKLLGILYSIIVEERDKKVVDGIRESIKDSIQRKSVVKDFRLDELPQLSAKFGELLSLLKDYDDNDPVKKNTQIANMLQDIMEMITHDIMKCGQGTLKDEGQKKLFANLNLDILKHKAWREKVLQLFAFTLLVRGMMYYRKALEIQYLQDTQDPAKFARDRRTKSYQELQSDTEIARAIADIKFTYVVSCQVYGMQKTSKNPKEKSCYQNILDLMIRNTTLRVAYIDEVEAPTGNGTTEKTYYSVLVKGGEKYDEEIYRIKLPGRPADIGEGKPENQNHAIIFTRGVALQTIDMNQDNYIEEAFKMRNVLEEFESRKYGKRKPTILGLREHIFTGSVSSLAWFMSSQETSFVTIGQRVLANLLKVRFHYGHPDIFDRLFHITRGGISKASKTINLSEDIFSVDDYTINFLITVLIVYIFVYGNFYLAMSGLGKSMSMDPRNQNVKALENALAPTDSVFQLGSLLVYGVSWLVMITILLALHVASRGRQQYGPTRQFEFRLIKGILFVIFVSVVAITVFLHILTMHDLVASILAFLPTGWCILLVSEALHFTTFTLIHSIFPFHIGQACSAFRKRTVPWHCIMDLARLYDNIIGLIVFLIVGFLSWFPFISEFQTRILFNQAFSRGLQISRLLNCHNEMGEFD
nr:unnamed protein product [Digitaria exilis]